MHSINTSIGKCFKKKEPRVHQDLQTEYKNFCISRIKKILQCDLQRETMNQAIRDSCKKPEEAEKEGRVEIRPSIPFVSDASYSGLDKDKSKFIEITCRYMPKNANSKKNNYQAYVKTFDHGTPEGVLLWYTKLQEIIKKKPYESPEACSP